MIQQNWKIERYLLGELPENEMTALKALEGENTEFRSQIEQLKKSGEELLAKYPAKQTVEKMHDNLRKFALIEQKDKWRLYLSACAALVMAATVLLTVFFDRNAMEADLANFVVMNEEGTRVKGLKAGLEIWRKTGKSTEKLSNNSYANAGDLLQVRYIAEKKCYGVILSVDGNGILTIHLSGSNGKAAELEAGKIVSLENAYELDDAPKYETFYLITDAVEFSLAPIAENLLRGELPKKMQVSQITLKKK